MAGVVIKFDNVQPIRPIQEIVSPDTTVFCPCDFRCDFEEKVFSAPSGVEKNGIINDVTDFLFKKISSSDTIEIQLLKGNVVVATISDDTYGAFYDGFDSQPLYVGWQADWTEVFNQFSGGRYQIRVLRNILGVESEFLSRYFRLNSYDDLEADKTVKIETLQRGRFENGEFDFTGLLPNGWPTSIRLLGKFGNMQPSIERDVFQDSSYREVQNRDVINREYVMNVNLVPESIQNKISTQDMLGNEIFVTSYNVLQELKYNRLPVVPESFGEVRYDDLGNTHFQITFSDRQKNNIKTNVP